MRTMSCMRRHKQKRNAGSNSNLDARVCGTAAPGFRVDVQARGAPPSGLQAVINVIYAAALRGSVHHLNDGPRPELSPAAQS